jgi:hypothetical protein
MKKNYLVPFTCLFLFIGLGGIHGNDNLRLDIITLEQRNSTLFVNYSYNNSDLIGLETEVIIRLLNDSGIEIDSYKDRFFINKDGLIYRGMNFNLSEIYSQNLLVNLVQFDSSAVTKNFSYLSLPRTSSLTGFTILNDFKTKVIGYIAFSLVVMIILIFILIKNFKEKQKNHNKTSFFTDSIEKDKNQ